MSYILSKSWIPYFLITLFIFIIYAPTIFYGAVYADDQVLVLDNYEFNQDLSNISQIFVEDVYGTPNHGGTYYRPILRLSFMLDAQFGEKNILFTSHLSNVIFHIFSMWLLFYLLTIFRIKKQIAILFTIILAAHPLATHSVAWIAGRNDSILAIFVLLTFIFLIKYLDTKKLSYCFFSLLFFALALWTKETAVVIPVILGIYILIFEKSENLKQNYKQYFGLLLFWVTILLVYFTVRQFALHQLVGNANYSILHSIYQNLPSLIPAMGKILLPFELSVFPILKDMDFTYGFISIAVLVITFVLSKNKNSKLVIFGISWFFVFVVLTLIKSKNITPEFSENRLYIPMFGFVFILLGLLNNETKNFQKKVFVISSVVILVLGTLTISHIKNYKDGLHFWKNAVETSPNHAFNHINLGIMHYLNANIFEAEKELSLALSLNERENFAHNFLGLIHLGEENLKEAKVEFEKEINLNPLYPGAYLNLGVTYYESGDLEKAKEYWKKTLDADPSYYNGNFYNLLTIYYNENDRQRLTKYLKEMDRHQLFIPSRIYKTLK